MPNNLEQELCLRINCYLKFEREIPFGHYIIMAILKNYFCALAHDMFKDKFFQSSRLLDIFLKIQISKLHNMSVLIKKCKNENHATKLHK